MNAPPMVEVTDQTDTLQIALEELKQKKVGCVRLSHNLNTVLDIVVLDLEHESTHSTKDFHWRKE